jgi:hypothetical protein
MSPNVIGKAISEILADCPSTKTPAMTVANTHVDERPGAIQPMSQTAGQSSNVSMTTARMP